LTGTASGHLGKPLSPACVEQQVDSFVVALPRPFAWPPGHFVVTGLSGAETRCITLFAAHLSILGATPAHLGCRVLKSRPRVLIEDYPGKL
jgi:hypothetical protein